MSGCPHVQNTIRALVLAQASPSEREALLEHAGTCPECGQVSNIHTELTRAAASAAEPSASEFAVARMNVLIRAEERAEHRDSRGFLRNAWRLAAAQPAGAVLVLLSLGLGALVGRLSVGPSVISDELLLRAIQAQAEASIGIAGFWDAPLVYTSVVARPVADDRVALSFDVSRHVDFVTSRESKVAKDVLVHAILDPSPMGARLQAIGLTEEIIDPKLRDAVIFVLHHDPSVAIRLEAIVALAEYPFDTTLQEALLMTLTRDVSVQIRMQALDLLRSHDVSPETIRDAMDRAGLDRDDPVLWRMIDWDRQKL